MMGMRTMLRVMMTGRIVDEWMQCHHDDVRVVLYLFVSSNGSSEGAVQVEVAQRHQ